MSMCIWQVVPVQVFGETLAVFRGEDGTAHVTDAYCPHIGANLAVGGVVKGDCLECPFHGWLFRGSDGACVHIPYSSKGQPTRLSLFSFIALICLLLKISRTKDLSFLINIVDFIHILM